MHPCLQHVWSCFKISDAQTKQLALVPLRDAIPSSSYQVACIDESGNARIIICSWEMWGGFWEQFQGVSGGVTVMLRLAVINAVEYPTSNWLLWKHTHTVFSLKGGATKIISRCVTQMSLLRNNSYSIITEPDACNQMRKYLSMHVWKWTNKSLWLGCSTSQISLCLTFGAIKMRRS